MKFLTVRDLRSKSSQIWKELPDEQEMVITNNGRPVAILSAINENNFESSLSAIRRARTIEAVALLQEESLKNKNDSITLEEINNEINDVRKNRNI